jgi:nucleotide-binding universal stress UspA family protein
MKRLKTIIVPTDLTENSRGALSYGCWLAEEERATLVILHVANDLDAWNCYSEDLAYVQLNRQPWPIDRVLPKRAWI